MEMGFSRPQSRPIDEISFQNDHKNFSQSPGSYSPCPSIFSFSTAPLSTTISFSFFFGLLVNCKGRDGAIQWVGLASSGDWVFIVRTCSSPTHRGSQWEAAASPLDPRAQRTPRSDLRWRGELVRQCTTVSGIEIPLFHEGR